MTVANDSNSIQQLRELLKSGETNEELVRQITDLFPALIYVYDTNVGRIRYVNRKITDLLGYTWDDVTAWKTQDLSSIIMEDDLPGVMQELEKLQQQNKEHSFQCRLNHKDQAVHIFKTVGTVLRRNETGKPESILLMSQDITEQLRLEEQHRAARELMDETEQMLGMGIWSYDKEDGQTDWSDGMYQLMGYSRKEMPVIPDGLFYQHVCPQEIDQLRANIKHAIESGKEFRQDFSIERKDGKRLYIMSIIKPVVNESGQVIRLNGMNRDISDQFQQALEYKANKEFQKQTERMLNYGLYVMNAATQTTTWSDGLYEIFEQDRAAVESKVSLNWVLEQIVEEDRERVRATVLDALKNGTEFDMEYSIVTAKGNLKIVNSKGTVIKDGKNNPTRLVGNTRDITHMKQVELELQRNLRELNRSNKELEEFAYAASHDLQEPLRKITTFGTRLQQKFKNELNDEGQMYLHRMQVATEHMRALIDNLLELSRVTRNKQPFEPVSLNNLLEAVMSDLELPIEETGAVVRVEDLPKIDGIPSLLRQLFINIISNSIKFHKPGEAPLIQVTAYRLSKKEKEEHFLLPAANYVKIEIRDNGIGFDQEYEQKIFQVFQRLHGKSEYPGSGIGLAICKRIAERHNGLISATGTENEGAVFSIILPEKQQ